MMFFTDELIHDFLRAYVLSYDFAGNLQENVDYTSRMDQLNYFINLFFDRYNAYTGVITVIESTLQQIHTINPRFELFLPPFDTITVTPEMQLVINFLHPDFV